MRVRALIIAASALLASMPLAASGPLGVYGLIERVVFEPNEAQAERVQLWGAFAYVDGGVSSTRGTSKAERGYMYFQLPANSTAAATTQVRREWNDLKSVAGTGQVVGFGAWMYFGAFGILNPAARNGGSPYIRVRSGSETPSMPEDYRTDSGIVKISATGDRAGLVKELQDALRK